MDGSSCCCNGDVDVGALPGAEATLADDDHPQSPSSSLPPNSANITDLPTSPSEVNQHHKHVELKDEDSTVHLQYDGLETGPIGTFDLIFMGTGVSIGIPNLGHVLVGKCKTCMKTYLDPTCHDRRNNVSIALAVNGTGEGPEGKIGRDCVLVDAGKTMRDSILRQFPREAIKSIKALLLTHDHADATMGMDDLRDLQKREMIPGMGYRAIEGPLKVFLQAYTMETLKLQFGYLTAAVPFADKEKNILRRNVALLDWQVIEDHSNFEAAGIPIRAFPVYHGGQYICLGFAIGQPGELVYMSDVKELPLESVDYLGSLGSIKVLVVDCLARDGEHYSHFNLDEALRFIDSLRPQRVLLVGMCCDLSPHEEINQELHEKGYPHVSLAYDGMVLRGIPI